MPTYRYRCTECGEDMEVWQPITDPAITHHDGTCGGELVKVLSPAGIVLKGSGFYKTDNRSGNGKRPSSTKDKDSSGSEPSKKPDTPAKESKESSSTSDSSTTSKPATTSKSPTP